MRKTEQNGDIQKTENSRLKRKLHEFIERTRQLQGDPHYIAMGMAIGVFVAITPTIPFHTAIALTLAFILRGSKPAAAIGVWVSNPITIPFFYLGCYKAGIFLLGAPVAFDPKNESILELLQQGLDVTIAMIVGGAIIGILPGVAAYFITRRIFTAIRTRKQKKHNP